MRLAVANRPPCPCGSFSNAGEKLFDLPSSPRCIGSQHVHQFIEQFRTAHHRLPVTAAAQVGPEAISLPAEMELITSSGPQSITLGQLVLRSDTAAITAFPSLNHELQPTA